VSGGSSVGDFDFVPAVLGRLGFAIKYDRVSMQPGRPTLFSDDGRAYCFGIPGNPAATFVVFEILVKPFLYRLMGHEYRPVWTTAVLDEDIRRRKVSRPSTVPIAFPSPGHAVPLDFHGSAHIQAMSAARGLFTIPAGTAEIPKGTTIHVRSL
jgi:molybdopterin molybdotransferase